jgi:hypothetical protein
MNQIFEYLFWWLGWRHRWILKFEILKRHLNHCDCFGENYIIQDEAQKHYEQWKKDNKLCQQVNCEDKITNNSVFCGFHSDNLPF